MPFGDRVLLRPGDYRIRATQAGYAPGELKVRITKASNQQFTLSLAKLPGHLTIDVPAPARVTIDGRPAGKAPGEFELAAGKHSVQIAAERYQPFTADVEVTGLGKKQTFKPALVPGWGDVTVTSEPATSPAATTRTSCPTAAVSRRTVTGTGRYRNRFFSARRPLTSRTTPNSSAQAAASEPSARDRKPSSSRPSDWAPASSVAAAPVTGADLGGGPGAGKLSDEDLGGASDMDDARAQALAKTAV